MSVHKPLKKEYALMDGRFLYDEDKAITYQYCKDLKGARYWKKDYPEDTVIVEIELENISPKGWLIKSKKFIE